MLFCGFQNMYPLEGETITLIVENGNDDLDCVPLKKIQWSNTYPKYLVTAAEEECNYRGHVS